MNFIVGYVFILFSVRDIVKPDCVDLIIRRHDRRNGYKVQISRLNHDRIVFKAGHADKVIAGAG